MCLGWMTIQNKLLMLLHKGEIQVISKSYSKKQKIIMWNIMREHGVLNVDWVTI